jgi:hypothetical protein
MQASYDFLVEVLEMRMRIEPTCANPYGPFCRNPNFGEHLRGALDGAVEIELPPKPK